MSSLLVRSPALVVASLVTALLLGGCGAPSTPTTRPSGGPPVVIADTRSATQTVDAESFELRALLLLMADRRLYEPLAAGAAATHDDPDLRRQAALALGRARDARGLGALRLLVADDEPAVRRTAAFALGELAAFGVGSTRAPLLAAVADSDLGTSRRAIEALARSGAPLDAVVERLVRVPSNEIVPRLAPSLFRFDSDGVVGWA
ncbi:MAG: HEAT repeat domain-containing protein, partial [Acidobacteriota bacterium]